MNEHEGTADKIVSYSSLDTLRSQAKLEGALGYAARIGTLLAKEKDIEKVKQIITEDAESISGALSEHYKNDLELAGFGYGLFRDETKTQ